MPNTLSTTRSFPYIYSTWYGYGIGLGSLYRDTYVSVRAHRFHTTHVQYIDVENNVDNSVERGAFSTQRGC
jgi:hypothetical protein